MNPLGSKKKINFWILFTQFRLKVVKRLFLTVIGTILLTVIYLITNQLISGNAQIETNNYFLLLPEIFQEFFSSLNKEQFTLLSLSLVFFYSLIYYFDTLWEEELRVRGNYHTKNRLLNKFRSLPFEERNKRSKEINNLVELDTGEVGYTWEHLPNHVFHSFLSVTLLVILDWKKIQQMSTRGLAFSVFWLILANLISFFFYWANSQKRKKIQARINQRMGSN